MRVVNRVKALRTSAGMTQKALAERVGVTAPCVCRWERGEMNPEIEKLFRLSAIFDVPIEQIVQRTESA